MLLEPLDGLMKRMTMKYADTNLKTLNVFNIQ